MTNHEIAEYTLDALKRAGAEGAAVGVSRGSTDELNIDGGKFSLMRTLFNSGLSLKALVGGRKGNAAVNMLDKDSIDEAVASCISSARSGVPDEAERIAPTCGVHRFEDGEQEPDTALMYDRLQQYLDDTARDYPSIMMEQVIATFDRGEELYLNSNGTEFSSVCGDYGFESMFSAHRGEQASSFCGYAASTYRLDRPFVDMDGHRNALRDAELSLSTRPVDGKFIGSVILTPDCVSWLMGSVLGNFMGDSVIIDGTSPWLSRLGDVVADKRLCLSTIPLDSRIVSGERYSGGFLSENMDYIADGVLQGFALGDYASQKTGYARAKNQSGSLWVKPGGKSLEDMISGIDHGLIVARFSGGSPSQNGDFSGVAKNSFLIENGRITDAVSETMINGNFAAMLTNIIDISRETLCDGSCVLPWMSFGGVTISGK